MTDEQLTADLEVGISNLRDRCRNAPRNSYSAKQTAAYLDRLEVDESLSTAEKLAAVRREGRQLTLDLKLNSDVINHSPNLGPDSNPRPPRRK